MAVCFSAACGAEMMLKRGKKEETLKFKSTIYRKNYNIVCTIVYVPAMTFPHFSLPGISESRELSGKSHVPDPMSGHTGH